jgi:hypothetical protein
MVIPIFKRVPISEASDYATAALNTSSTSATGFFKIPAKKLLAWNNKLLTLRDLVLFILSQLKDFT